MDFFEMLSNRRSVRRFRDEVVSETDIAKILEQALDAPSSKNTRSTGFIVVENRDLLCRISAMRDFGSAFIQKAPLVILVTGDKTKTDLWQINASISATYIQLSAQWQGLASCWVHVDGRPHRQDEPDGLTAEQYLREFISIPDERGILCAIVLGYKESDSSLARKEYGDKEERVVIIK